MKLLSLWEPWATLMAIGAKRIETRSWGTHYRGWLAIQASKGGLSKSDLEIQCENPQFRRVLMAIPAFADWMNCVPGRGGTVPPGVFPHGHIVAVVNLLDVLPIDTDYSCDSHVFDDYPELDTPQERAFGNYDDLGRFGWITDKLFRIPTPIPFKAKQGLCEVDETTVDLIRAQWGDERHENRGRG